MYGLHGAISYDRAGRNRIKITFKEAANNAILKANIRDVTKAYIPTTLVFQFGIILKMPTDLSENELLENIPSTVQVSLLRRISRFVNRNLLPPQSLEIKFLSNDLPSSVKIYGLHFESILVLETLVYGSNYLQYEHGPKQCRSKSRCIRCSNENTSENCTVPIPTNLMCHNCKDATIRNARYMNNIEKFIKL